MMEEQTTAEATPTFPNLTAAMADFQANLPKVFTGSEAEVVTKTGKTYTYDYADMAAVAEIVLPELGSRGIWYVTWTAREGAQLRLLAELRHVTGGAQRSEWDLPDSRDPQTLGSSMTYGRRYMLLAMSGIHPRGEDDDGEKARDRARRLEAGGGGGSYSYLEPNRPSNHDALKRVIAMGRDAGETDEKIRADLDALAAGKGHDTIEIEPLQKLWRIYRNQASEAAEKAAALKAQEKAEAGDPPPGDGAVIGRGEPKQQTEGPPGVEAGTPPPSDPSEELDTGGASPDDQIVDDADEGDVWDGPDGSSDGNSHTGPAGWPAVVEPGAAGRVRDALRGGAGGGAEGPTG